MLPFAVESNIQYAGSWTGASSFGKLCALAGDRAVVRKARTDEAAAYQIPLCQSGPY